MPADRRERLTTVWFNAWQYEHDALLLVPLICAILEALEADSPSTRWLDNLSHALRAVLAGLSTKLDVQVPVLGKVALSFSADKAVARYERLSERMSKHWIDTEIASQKSLQALRELDGIAEPDSGLVVFIDDLDRCMPQQALRLLNQFITWQAANSPGITAQLLTPWTLVERLREQHREAYGLLMESPALCSELSGCRSATDLRARIADVVSRPQSVLALDAAEGASSDAEFDALAEDRRLHYLLASAPGQDWLEDEPLRRALDYLAAMNDFFHQECRKAIKKLESLDVPTVLAGLDTIVAYSNLCPALQERVHQSLVGLLEKRSEAKVIDAVKVVLERIGCGIAERSGAVFVPEPVVQPV